MQREEMERLVAGAPSLSAKIRILHDAGVKKADIARFVDRRYQHVRNVILDHEKKQAAALSGQTEAAASDGAGEVFELTLSDDGSVKLPNSFLEAQHFQRGASLICRVERDGLRIISRDAAVRELAATLKQRLPQEAALLATLLGRPDGSP